MTNPDASAASVIRATTASPESSRMRGEIRILAVHEHVRRIAAGRISHEAEAEGGIVGQQEVEHPDPVSTGLEDDFAQVGPMDIRHFIRTPLTLDRQSETGVVERDAGLRSGRISPEMPSPEKQEKRRHAGQKGQPVFIRTHDTKDRNSHDQRNYRQNEDEACQIPVSVFGRTDRIGSHDGSRQRLTMG